MSLPAAQKARVNQIHQLQKEFRQHAKEASSINDHANSTQWQLKILDLHIEKDTIHLNHYTAQNSPNRHYWNDRLRMHRQQKTGMLGQSVLNDTQSLHPDNSGAVSMSKDELEAKIVSSGLKQAMADANAAQDWDEANRISALIQKMRAELIWIDFTLPGVATQPVKMSKNELEAKIVSSGLKKAMADANAAKNWPEANRIAALIQKMRAELVWIDYKASANSEGDNSPQIVPDTGIATNDQEFIKYVAKIFMQATQRKKQDTAHDAIINRLLGSTFSADKVTNDPNKAAYEAVRGANNQNLPLLQINNQNQVNDQENNFPLAGAQEQAKYPALNTDNKKVLPTIFIRDFMGIRSTGGISVQNWLVEDKALTSAFQKSFDKIVNAAQNHVTRGGEIRSFKDVAHRDALQLLPFPNSTGSDQLAGAVMSNVTIQNNIIASDGALQGIFASDGSFKNLTISNNHLKVAGSHTITINGMLSGSLSGNTDLNNRPLSLNKIKLLPLRIGGGTNIYILGFSNKPGTPADERYHYDPISGIDPNSPIDARARKSQYTINSPGATFYNKVDMQEFHKEYARKKDFILQIRRERNSDKLMLAYRNIMRTLVTKNFAVKI